MICIQMYVKDWARKDWQQHFSALLNVNYKTNDAEFEAMVREYVDVHNENCHTCELGGDEMLNGSITGEEIKKSIMSMKNSKAPGKDGIVSECFKMSMEFIIPKLSILFNKILYLGKFPNQWGLALICPLHKKGSPNVPSNYRGISLLNVMGKIFRKVLNNRLVRWGNVYSKFYEEQAGFREKYCTVDQIFVLNSVVQKYLSRPKGRFYCAFVDFSTAFDCIQHNLLFYALVKKGVHGNFIKVIQSMYKSLKSCVKTPQGLTEVFDCSTGTRQRCILSPLFFTLFLNEYIDMIKDSTCQGVYVNEFLPNLMVLLYADDLVQCADLPGRLQQQLNILADFCDKWCMKVNLEKTNIIVFRNGGIIKRNEMWYLNGKQLKTVTYYKYLGLVFSSKLSWSKATYTLASQARKAIALFRCFDYRVEGVDPKKALLVFDKAIAPILFYGAELWGHSMVDSIERVQLSFCKYILGVGKAACNEAVLGEVGRLPMFVQYHKKCIKYWLKLIEMSTTRCPFACYKMLKELDDNGRHTWASNVRILLSRYGFGHVWLNQGVGDSIRFIKEFYQRICDCATQEWNTQKSEYSS